MPSDKRQRQREGARTRQQQLQAQRQRQSRRNLIIVFGAIAAIVAIVAVVASSGGSEKKNADEPVVGAACPKLDGSSPKTGQFPAPPRMCIDPAKTYTAEMKTTKGSMTITLDTKKAPRTVNNFVFLARYHYYDGVPFHRIIPGFVVQGGDPQGTGTGGPGYKFADELPKAGEYELGSLAMANSGPNTNGSQFFIITGDQGVALPPKYSLFGKVTTGFEVAKALEAVGTPGDGKPSEPVQIESVTITES